MNAITINNKSTYALTPQKKVGIFDFPFTLNPYIGCEMGCMYCFVPKIIIKKSRDDFFHNVEIKENVPTLLKKELKKYSNLPQHLKRVQIGVTTELFQPKVIQSGKINLGYDPIEKILEIFYEEDQKGNHWMIHLLTKNHNIVKYKNLLSKMKHMVQVEISIIHHDEKISRKYENYTSTIKRRLDAIETLSQNGIFVRVMAMPFYGNQNDLDILKNMVFAEGASAFKNKSLNYYDWTSFDGMTLSSVLERTTIKTNTHMSNYIIKSGEELSNRRRVSAVLPKDRYRGDKFINWAIHPDEGLQTKKLKPVDMGYKKISKYNWKYIN
ncbi:MAG: radical SAM protein [Melioribacteraceae bacterium]|nr:radical SAM protein [Melioribacteraceae bacterium]